MPTWLSRKQAVPAGDTRYLRARVLAYVERWEEAEPLMRELLDESPDSYAHIGYLGWILANAGKTTEAVAMRDRLASLDLEFFQRAVRDLLAGRHIHGFRGP